MEVHEPDWAPLEAVLRADQCADFMYMGHVGELVLYKHRDTRRYINIHAKTGEFFRYSNGVYALIDRDSALKDVMR